MQKHNKNKNIHVRSHHVRISAVAIALATAYHVSGMGHIGKLGHELATFNTVRGFHTELNGGRAFHNEIERENETARHMVRFDAGLRLPSVSGG
jgi:hypothetical protein